MSEEVRQHMIKAVKAMHEYLMSLGAPQLEKDVTFNVLQDFLIRNADRQRQLSENLVDKAG